jgi:hypothetical protein
VLGAAEADAAIHRQPAFPAGFAVAVQVQIHANFARPAEWQEGQITVFYIHI